MVGGPVLLPEHGAHELALDDALAAERRKGGASGDGPLFAGAGGGFWVLVHQLMSSSALVCRKVTIATIVTMMKIRIDSAEARPRSRPPPPPNATL